MSKTKTETQDLQDQYWKSMTGMDCDKQKDWKVMASRKSSIGLLVVAHSEQQNIIPCLATVISAVTVNHCSVSNFCEYTQHFTSMMFGQQLKR